MKHSGNISFYNKDGRLKLLSVHVVIRHGDRLHLNPLPDNSLLRIPCHLSVSQLKSSHLAARYERAMRSLAQRQSNQTFHGMDLHPDQEWCGLGHLTPYGAMQHVITGDYLRRKYLHMLSMQSHGHPEEAVLVKSTKYSRNFQSAIAFMHGFLPDTPPTLLNMEKVDNVSFCSINSGHPCQCAASEKFKDIFPARFRQLGNNIRTSRRIIPVYDNLSKVFGVDPEAILPPSHNMDIFMAHVCHATPLSGNRGQCLASRTVRNLYDALSENGQEALKDSNYLRGVRLNMQPLLYEIAERMIKQTAKQTKPLKFVLYSGHDTTIEPLAAALGFSSGIWARYASRIVFELYHNTLSPAKQYVRVLYNGRVVTDLMPFCRNSDQIERSGLCPLRQLVNFVRMGNMRDLGARDYEEACAVPIDADPY
ncbi:hypothetical protein CAPTEDRAFT_146243 [Capitella teleta]|uniref:2-phosphoxylose phosphatase 1 n=1 Tax=Capitella teleta TaxID=283909 RepID=R7VC68_CAPTE|nr:hypothetical protein CAPTEDRAFT_146243 [Capitella teleta]|eukprot:ELU13270.1 hypothetical protein CAPTEDRAFT_146243 [Capitella teleta]